MKLLALAVSCSVASVELAGAEPVKYQEMKIEIGYLARTYPEPMPISLLEPVITDQGILGARLGIKDDEATGRFLGQAYHLEERTVPENGDVVEAAKALLTVSPLLIADLEPDDLLRVADLPEARDAIIVNACSSNDELRGKNCRRNVFHVAPSWAMRADALAQYMAWKRWDAWFLLRGNAKADVEYADAIARAAKKFGSRIVEERTITFDPGNRRSETGHQQIQSQIPALTQTPPPHEVVFVADTQETFGEYLMWRTSVPKPVAGTHGLVAVAWHRAYEQYGGVQLQNRFRRYAARPMTERDYLNWLAARVFGEAVTRSGKPHDSDGLRAYILSKQFQVAGFKGQGMSFRTWDRQLRQPIILSGPRSLVSMSPQEGYLHQNYLTDTLGVDAPETSCTLPD